MRISILLVIVFIGCSSRVEVQPNQTTYCDSDTTIGNVKEDLAVSCANNGGTCQCEGATVDGSCNARVICHMPDNKCQQYSGDISLICPNDKSFAMSCYVAIANPGQCVAANGQSSSDKNVLWCCD